MTDARPNILWIVTTQWRAQACGYAGDPNARTPHLDRLAAQSIDYTQAVTPHPFGPFARAALLTGVASPRNGVRDYFDPLPVGTRTIAHELGERGYATAFLGKWHLWKRDPTAPLVGEAHAKIIVPPEARGGFDFWRGFESGFLLNEPWLHGSGLPEPQRLAGYQPTALLDHFRSRFFAEFDPGDRPWFSVVSLETPHPPYAAPAGKVRGYDPAALQLTANVPRLPEIERKAREELAGYYAHIEATDAAIGAFLEFAKALSASRELLVVFTSVHGDMHGAHGLFRKGWPHEESVRVPLLIRVPRAENGRKENRPVSLLDLPQMMIDLVERGSLGSTASPCAQISMPSVVALPHQCDRAWRGVRTASRKLVLNADGSPWLFFDLARDPLELNNLVHDSGRAGEIAELTRMVSEENR